MRRPFSAEVPEQDGLSTSPHEPYPPWQPVPQKSEVVPQKPNWEQQTFKGQFPSPDFAYSPHGAVALQLDIQTSAAQLDGENEHTPVLLQQAPLTQGVPGAHVPVGRESRFERRPRSLFEVLWTDDLGLPARSLRSL